MSTANTQLSLRRRLRSCRSFLLADGSRPDTFMSGPIDADAIIVDLE